ncbi:MAG: hypothetical protein ACREJC_15175 [Tepidisphaeraceae bacterium]
MMRLALIVVVGMLGGCAAARHQQASPAAPTTSASQPTMPPMQDVSATALVFSPPVSRGVDLPDLSREGRQAGAFIGYQDQIATYFYIRTDDNQFGGGTGRYQRQAISVKVGASYR